MTFQQPSQIASPHYVLFRCNAIAVGSGAMNGDGMFFPWDGSNHPQGATVSWKFIIPVGDVGPTYIYRSMDEIMFMVNVGTYTIHESRGIYFKIFVETR